MGIHWQSCLPVQVDREAAEGLAREREAASAAGRAGVLVPDQVEARVAGCSVQGRPVWAFRAAPTAHALSTPSRRGRPSGRVLSSYNLLFSPTAEDQTSMLLGVLAWA